MATPRIVSLSPAATDVLVRLGLGGSLLGVSHECGLPADLAEIPVVTTGRRHQILALAGGSSANVLEEEISPYMLNMDWLRKLQPDLIFTDSQTSEDLLSSLATSFIGFPTQVVSLHANSIAEGFSLTLNVARTLDREEEGKKLNAQVEAGFRRVADRLRWKVDENKKRESVLVLTNSNPLLVASGFLAELLDKAQAKAALSAVGEPEKLIRWADVLESHADKILWVFKGHSINGNGQVLEDLQTIPELRRTQAFRAKQQYVANGRGLFLPGPSMGETLEVLLDLLHPEAYHYKHMGTGWSEFF
jgi:iron complex transport system substrate-binding protein